VAGAAIGCAVGHHRAKVHEKQAQAQAHAQAPSQTQAAPPAPHQ
jgi:hypothetical protein